MHRSKKCTGAQLALRNNFFCLTDKKDYSEMSKFAIQVELAEILPEILAMGDQSEILCRMQNIPLDRYPNFQKEFDISGNRCICIKKISKSAENLRTAIRMTDETQTGKFVIGQGIAYQEGKLEKKFSDYLNRFAEQFLNS